jgi:mitochondrial fission protein ELM1
MLKSAAGTGFEPWQVPTKPLVWLLMSGCVGDNNQLLALADALEFPFESKKLAFNQKRRLPFLRKGLRIVAKESRGLIAAPWPDLVIGVGYGSVPVARYIREQSGGRAKLVHIGNPRDKLEDFDLQITTPQYAREPVPNLLELPFPIGNPAGRARPTPEELDWIRGFPRPLRLVAIGGPARHWELDSAALLKAIATISRKAPRGSLVVTTSNRTTEATRRMLAARIKGEQQALVDHHPDFGTLLAESDEIYVTADSVSMVSEAILSGKRVGLIPIKRSLRGTLSLWLWEKPTGRRTFPDFGNFWRLLRRRRLVGTVELPVASQVCDTIDRAADAVRSVLVPGGVVDEESPKRTDPYLGLARRAGRGQ